MKTYKEEPIVKVGIMSEKKIDFILLTPYKYKGYTPDNQDIEGEAEGACTVEYSNGTILFKEKQFSTIEFIPAQGYGKFQLNGVTIGINFHWERKENQCFEERLKFIIEDEKITAVNTISTEAYLTSVISSEMSATASLELLKAHAVISRSWLLAQIDADKAARQKSQGSESSAARQADEMIKWYDHDDHRNYDVCADDHCQRYQGITKASTAIVREAIAQTHGEVLVYDNEICDARFSKSCGGAFEEFQYCWEDKEVPYLKKQRDSKEETSLPDLRDEKEAEKWIREKPASFCNTTDKHILSQVLNNYDQETTDFYRWKVTYTQKELSTLIKKRSGIDYGEIIDLQPIARGTSGRLYKLKIIGTERTLTIGKELEIRRTLSESHLYSSAFVVDKSYSNGSSIPSSFTITGAGWGHGVGLCQIGAAVMGEQGYNYREILLHYYIDAQLKTLY